MNGSGIKLKSYEASLHFQWLRPPKICILENFGRGSLSVPLASPIFGILVLKGRGKLTS